jgi:hypothetical protein
MKQMIVNYPDGFEAVLMKNLDEWSKFGVWAKPSEPPKRPIPGVFTREEKIARIRRAMADYRAGGRTYSEEEMDERIAKW